MKNHFEKEFQEFLNSPEVVPPQTVTEKILSFVHREFNPGPLRVFTKLAMIHFLVGLVSLAICPQFGFRTFGSGLGLMEYFYHLGPYVCMAACGAFFLGSSLTVAALLLKPEEMKLLRRQWPLQLAGIAFLSLGAFFMAEVQIIAVFSLVWITGSILGGLLMMEIGWKVRKLAIAKI